MDSPSGAGKATWHDGDSCLAPNPRDGFLQEAKIQRLTSTVHSNDTTAWVIFTDRNKDEKEEEEEAVPVSKLVRADLNCFTQEKPVFPNSIADRRLCVPLQLSDVNEDKVPYTINRYLRDYQREGIRFIYNNYIRASGCILGDDMGLGKTVQVIGFLAAVLHKTGTWEDVKNNRPQFLQSQIPSKQIAPKKVFLIVAPLSVLYNWKDELDTWGHFQYVVVHGLRKEEELARIKKGRTEIALTTFETLRLCLDQFNNTDWSAVIVDEAHKIKNPSSQITQAMKELKCKIRIGLTGTILQNNLEELWCVMDWAVPGCLGSLGHFKNIFSEPIEQGQRYSATKRVLATGRKTVRALVRKISHWFLRRTKALIKEQLPKKDDRVVYCSLTDFQQNVYQTVLDTEDVMLLLRSSEKCDCRSGSTRRRCCYKRNSEGVQMKELYFIYLAILRKVANHVALLQSSAGTSKKQEKYLSAICQMVFQKFPDFVQRCKDEAFEALSDPVYSGKMKVLQKLLKYYLQKRDKVLIFSLSTKLLDVLERYCMAEGLDYRRLDGTTKSKERVQIVKEFNRSSHINLCLVSTMAGGLGLNFVGANVVVLFDPTWNPANDLQAIDRAYRIGQCRDVTILRLISLGTIEEIIYLRQVYKQQLQCSVFGKECSRRYFEAVQGHSVHKGELFGIKNLFHLQTQGTCLTRKILEREGRMEAGVMTSSTHTDEEKEESRKGVSEPGNSPPTAGLAPNDEPTKETRNPSKVWKGVLDFSSGSEEDEDEHKLKRKAKVNDITAGNGPGQMSLLEHGFSKFFERVRETAVSGEEDDCLNTEDSHFDSEDHGKLRKSECTSTGDMKKSSSAETEAVCLPKLGTKVLDVSSASDREDQRNGTGGRQEGSFLSKERTDKFSRDKKPNKFKTAVQRIHCFEDYSDESEDFDLEESTRLKKGTLNTPSTGKDRERGTLDSNRKRQTPSVRDKARTKCTEAIEAYTSSEDERTPVKKARSSGSHLTSLHTQQSRHDMPKDGKRAATTDRTERQKRDGGTPKAVLFTNLKSETSPASKRNKQQGKEGSIDSLLGGVQEVVSVHSNHRVVGGSKAEDLISRAAIRDVFERKLYSQLPANHLLGTQESLSESPPDSLPYPETVRVERPSVAHPVSFTSKSVHHTRHSTIIIGETPHAIRRQQLGEMAEKFQFHSVDQFVAEILRSSSTQRLAWLRQYYTSLSHPDLANAVKKNFPQSDSRQITLAATSSRSKVAIKSHTQTRTPQKDVPKATKKPNCSLKNLQNDVPEPRTSPENPLNDVREPQKKQKISQKNVLEPVSDGPCTDSEEQKETLCTARGHRRTKRDSVSTPGAGCSAGGGLGVYQASSSGLGSRKTAFCLNCTDRDTLSSPDLSHGRSTMLSKPTAQGREQEQKSASRTKHTFHGNGESCQTLPAPQQTPSTSSNRSFLTDLIGDTSILDDLFKPKPKGVKQRSTPRTPPLSASANTGVTTPSSKITPYTDSTPEGLLDSLSSLSSHTPSTFQVNTQVQPSKGGRKDFWDILNEGNEESINRLTDPAEVRRVCVNTNFSARSRSGEDTKNLWKTNEKFLWRK